MKILNSSLARTGGAVLLIGLAIACSNGGGSSNNPPVSPTVLSNTPVDQTTDVEVNASMSATFSEAMDSTTLTDVTFTVVADATATPVAGTVIYANSTAVFWPAAHLDSDGSYTATITTGAHNPAGIGLTSSHVWKFTTGTTMGPGQPVALGLAANFAILAKAGIATVPTSAITGNLGISPAAATAVTGFDLILDASNTFSKSTQVTGNVYASDYAPPTPSGLTSCILDMQTAFTDAAGRAPDVTELGAGDIGGMTLAPGVYKWGTGVLIPTDVTLSGSATDVWIFEIAQDLTVASATSVVLTGGAVPENVFWQVTGLVDLGTTANFSGIVLSATAITLQTGASVHGRLLAQTAVNIDNSTVVVPGL